MVPVPQQMSSTVVFKDTQLHSAMSSYSFSVASVFTIFQFQIIRKIKQNLKKIIIKSFLNAPKIKTK